MGNQKNRSHQAKAERTVLKKKESTKSSSASKSVPENVPHAKPSTQVRNNLPAAGKTSSAKIEEKKTATSKPSEKAASLRHRDIIGPPGTNPSSAPLPSSFFHQSQLPAVPSLFINAYNNNPSPIQTTASTD